MKETISNNIKNIPGWRTKRKLIVFAVDDYGNVRLDSKKARDNMDQAGLKPHSNFDAYDTLETKQDLEHLFEVLSSVKDKNGRSAIFTPFSLPCNINFEKMAKEGYQEYRYEQLPQTYAKLTNVYPEAYEGAWKLWQEGLKKGFMAPQFHGREHFNLKVFKEKLAQQDPEIMTALKNRSYTTLSNTGYSTISFTGAFDFWDFGENETFESIIQDGLNAFEEVFGYRATQFNSPGGREHPYIHKFLANNGVKFIDTPFIKKEHQGFGKYKTKFNYSGKKNDLGMTYMVRNVVFEPTNKKIDHIAKAMRQIEAAFRWNKPAIISSHRMNFCGHIDPENRTNGLIHLKSLLKSITQKWPDVEFITGDELGELVQKDIK